MVKTSIHGNYLFSNNRPSGYEFKPAFIFNSPAYLDLYEKPDFSFYLINEERDLVSGVANFFAREDLLISPINASFGGFDFKEKDNIVKEEFIEYVLDHIQRSDIERIQIRSFPEAYSLVDAQLIEHTLLKFDFRIIRKEPNHHIVVDHESFMDKIVPMEKRKMTENKVKDFEFREESPLSLERIYQFIAKCRQERDYNMTMSLDRIIKTFRKIPGIFKLFAVYHQDEIIAASVCVVINEHILYNFYPASPLSRKKDSPVVFLNSGIYQFCQDHGFKILDLGTSYIGDGPNHSLIKFKENLGGLLSFRTTFEKSTS
jgi:GNAT acetyltransferase-like protein